MRTLAEIRETAEQECAYYCQLELDVRILLRALELAALDALPFPMRNDSEEVKGRARREWVSHYVRRAQEEANADS